MDYVGDDDDVDDDDCEMIKGQKKIALRKVFKNNFQTSVFCWSTGVRYGDCVEF